MFEIAGSIATGKDARINCGHINITFLREGVSSAEYHAGIGRLIADGLTRTGAFWFLRHGTGGKLELRQFRISALC